MNTTTKVLIGVAVLAALGGAAFWAFKSHPEWFGRTQNPNQVNPAAPPPRDRLTDRINAGTNALDTLSNVVNDWLG